MCYITREIVQVLFYGRFYKLVRDGFAAIVP